MVVLGSFVQLMLPLQVGPSEVRVVVAELSGAMWEGELAQWNDKVSLPAQFDKVRGAHRDA